MGALSALIVGPCVAGPLAGALLYISQTGNAWIGGWALFSMAVGMSVPLLLIGLSAGSLLPRAGAWMNGVKRVFGLRSAAVAYLQAPLNHFAFR
jgi:thioredoxin:protein disulfide reductase